jgi:hypothetical protein
MYQWLILIHVVSSFLFFMAHGLSIGVALRLRYESQPDRLRALLELSEASRLSVRVSLIFVLLSGIGGGFMGNWWSMGWIWVSLGLMIVVTVVMMRGVSPYFHKLRKAAGSDYIEGGKKHPAQPVNAAELETLLKTASHMQSMAAIGTGIMVVILFLMRFKPF